MVRMSDIEDFDADEDFGIDEPYYGDGWCVDCGEEFHLDDCGGYNPPCACGFHCRSCHQHAEHEDDDYEYDERDEDDESERATESVWDGRVGHEANATDDNELPF
jgi:hypothetical protein